MRFLGLFAKLSMSLFGYRLPPLKNLRHGDEESDPMVGESVVNSAAPRPLGVTTPEEEAGEA